MDSRLELCSGAGMNDMGGMQQDRTQRSSARTRQGRDAQGRRRRAEAGGRLPADVQRKSLLDSTYVAKYRRLVYPGLFLLCVEGRQSSGPEFTCSISRERRFDSAVGTAVTKTS